MAFLVMFVTARHVRVHNATFLPPVLAVATLCDMTALGLQATVYRVLQGDAKTWHLLGALAADYLTGRTSDAVNYVDGKEGYIWILGALYSFGGPAPLVAVAFGIACHLLTIIVVSSLTRSLTEQAKLVGPLAQSATKWAGWLVAVLPCFVWWTPQVLRESLTLLLIASAANLTVLILVRRQFIHVVLVAIVLFALISVRGSLGAVVTAAVMFALFYVLVGRSRYRLFLRLLAILAFALLANRFQDKLLSALDSATDVASATTRELAQVAASGFASVNSQAGLVEILSITAPRVLAGPFPWEFAPTAVMILAYMEFACWFFVVVVSVRGISRFRLGGFMRPAAWVLPVIIAILFAVILGVMLTVGNYGILARFRPIATLLLIPIASIGLLRVPGPAEVVRTS